MADQNTTAALLAIRKEITRIREEWQKVHSYIFSSLSRARGYRAKPEELPTFTYAKLSGLALASTELSVNLCALSINLLETLQGRSGQPGKPLLHAVKQLQSDLSQFKKDFISLTDGVRAIQNKLLSLSTEDAEERFTDISARFERVSKKLNALIDSLSPQPTA